MTSRRKSEIQMQISEGELLAMTRDLDEIHHATLPAMHEAVAEFNEMNHELRDDAPPRRRGPSRRNFLVGAGATVGGLVLAACSSSSKTSSTGTTAAGTDTTTGGGSGLTGDLAVAALAASLENLAVQTYAAGLTAATAGKLGAIPPAVATFATTAKMQHNDHAAAWNSILTNAGKSAVTGVDTTVRDAVVTPGFAKVTNAAQLAQFALVLENAAAATYLNGIQNALTSQGAIKVAATIQPVEMQHAAILNYVLGTYPIPDSFAQTTGARPPSDAIG